MGEGSSAPVQCESRTLLCVGTDGDFAMLGRALEDSIWRVEHCHGADAVGAAAALDRCNAAVAVISSESAGHLEGLRRILWKGDQLAWLALLQRPLLERAPVREFVVQHCSDYHSLPIDRDRLLYTLGHAAGMAALRASSDHGLPGRLAELLGESEAMKKLHRELLRAAAVEEPILITGESGTGKALVAQAIHGQSRRARAAFETLGCVSVQASLIHARLFGHERRVGGTLFLDEIGDLSPDAQALLLRFLDGLAVPGGGEEAGRKVETRIICATHIDLEAAVQRGQFREDLYFRLNVLRIHLPPLRERADDVELIARACLARHTADASGPRREFSPAALSALRNFNWPGNVRELINRVRRAVVMSEEQSLTPADLGFQPILGAARPMPMAAGRLVAERKMLLAALEVRNWRAKEAALDLGVSRATFYRMLQRHGIRLARGGVAGAVNAAPIRSMD